MPRHRFTRVLVLAGALGLLAGAARAGAGAMGWFLDRPVAWYEHDDANVPAPPEANHLQDLDVTLILRDSLANEVDRVLALDGALPAEDVNALDEVPCSTWFCARNHLGPMSPEEVAAGAPAARPRLPLTIVKGKDQGAATGFQVVDAAGRKFMLKVDPAGHVGMATGAEVVGEGIFHAAGYNVPGAFVLDLAPEDLRLDPRATFRLYEVKKQPLTEARVRAQLAGVGRLPDGRIRATAVPWVPGRILGSFDLLGVRAGDPNDRIPHEHRRSLRATRVLFAWISELDPSAINTIDTYVAEGGRHFVRHYIIDFGASLGSSTFALQGPQGDGSYVVEVGRTLGAFASLGILRRPFQDRRAEWEALVARYPAAGYYPAESFDPDAYRPNRKLPTHMRMTARDAYWGAKIVTSFSDAQLAALVASARFPEPDASYVAHALGVRRDIIGRRYLRAVSAVENPTVAADGAQLCFDDLAVARGYAEVGEARYAVEVSDGLGHVLASGEARGDGPRVCLGISASASAGGYRVVRVATRLGGGEPARATLIHLRWRASERRFVVVGLAREE